MPEGPVGLCFFEQFVSQTDAGEGKQGQNTHTGKEVRQYAASSVGKAGQRRMNS